MTTQADELNTTDAPPAPGPTHYRDPCPTYPDAALLAACAHFQKIHEEWNGQWLGDDWSDAMCAKWDAAMEAVGRMRPTTAEGVQARAGVARAALIWHVATYTTKPWQKQANEFELLAIDALGDAAGRAWAMEKILSPDAAMLALCAEFHAIQEARGVPELDDDTSDRLCFRWAEVMDKIAEIPARTHEGILAKAIVARGAIIYRASERLGVPWQEQATREALVAVSVFDDMARRA